MPGAKPTDSSSSSPKTHSTVCLVHHQHLHMHQHTHQHAFTPILHQSLTSLPAPMGTQDSNFNKHLPREATRPSFAPVTAFHRATQKPFRSTKRGRWGALHVCIAWKIYYHQQLEKMQQKSNSLHQELTPEYPAISLPDTVQHKESDQSSSIHLNIDPPCGYSAYGNISGRSETGRTAENLSHFNRNYHSDLFTSAPVSCHSRTTKREKLETLPNLHRKEKLDEKEKHGAQQSETAKDLPLRHKSWDPIPELGGRHGGSLDRKRQLECDSFVNVKRVKQEIVDDQFDSSKTLHTDPSPFSTRHTYPSSHTMPVQHINASDLSVLYPNTRSNVTRAPGGLISYPGAEMHPYQTALWEPMWDFHKRMDLHFRQNVQQDYSLNTHKVIRMPLVAQKQKEAFHGFFTRPLYFPLALRQQETVYLRGREFLHSRQENCHLQHPGYLATPYLGP